MEKVCLAVPSNNPGGLEAGIGAHFGRCEVYTLVYIENGAVTSVKTLPAIPHSEGGCGAPVRYLAENGVNTMLAGGMGMRPLMGFHENGIEVFHTGESRNVKEGVDAFLQGKLPVFSRDYTCGGH